MKHQTIFLIMLLSSLLAIAQPNVATAGKAKPSNVVADTAAKRELSQQAPFYQRERLLATYMSVSYPLATIHITSPYGYRADPFTGKLTLHNGIDLRAANRSEVYAMLAGRVVAVGYDHASGNYLTIKSGSYLITYCHLSLVLVRKGATVAPGSLVAFSGNTGTRSTGPHLHISVKHITTDGTPHYIDPTILLNFVRATHHSVIASLLALDNAAP